MAKDETTSDALKGTATNTASDTPAPAASTDSATAPASAAPAAAAESDSRHITIKLDDAAATALGNKADGTPYKAGDTLKRKEYILLRWAQKIGRGPIAKELTRLQGKDVAYQIVFQATDKVPGGPDKAAPAPAATDGAAPASATPPAAS